MLKELTDISNISVIQQRNNGNIYGVQKIQYDENPFGSGGVGSVYRIENIDGKTVEGLLIKLISDNDFVNKTYDTISLLHNKINERQQQTNTPIFIEFPELSGLPFLIFKARINGTEDKVTGMIVYNLSVKGYVDYGDETFDRNKYFSVDFTDKLYLAYQLARGIDFLHELKFIHSDLKDNSIFINLNIPQIAIIDFDGGFNYDKQSSALTLGAIQSWASSKFRKAIGLKKSAKDFTFSERLDEEKWNLAIGIFEVFFGIQPFYFLKDNEEVTFKLYLNNNNWPNIPKDLTLVEEKNLSFHNNLTQLLEVIGNAGLKPIVDTFKNIFNSGYKNESKRLSPKQWKELLFKLSDLFIGAPQIENFKSNKEILDFKGDSIEFNWIAKYYRSIQLNGIYLEQQLNKNIMELEDECEVELLLKNDFGETRNSISIKANRITPKIKIFESSKIIRTDLTPVKLMWETLDVKKVQISHVSEVLQPNGEINVNPMEKTIYVLTGFGNFDQQVSAILEIDVQSAQINLFKYEINIERGIDNVDLFWETKNALEVEIFPRIGRVELNGQSYIGILDRTEFTISAKGYFNEVNKTIEAQPFPIPIIKGIFIPTPIVNLENTVPEHLLEIPISLTNFSNLNFNSSIDFDTITPNFTELDSKLKAHYDVSNIVPKSENLFNRIFKNVHK